MKTGSSGPSSSSSGVEVPWGSTMAQSASPSIIEGVARWMLRGGVAKAPFLGSSETLGALADADEPASVVSRSPNPEL